MHVRVCVSGDFGIVADLVAQNNVNPRIFPSITVDGVVPPPLCLAVAMHAWQWQREGEITQLGLSEVDDN